MKIVKAVQITRNPAKRSAGIGSPNAKTARRNCTVGVRYCSSPR
jgi:hypothetical protein